MTPLVTNEEAFRIGQRFAMGWLLLVAPVALLLLAGVLVVMPLTVGGLMVLRAVGRVFTGWPFREQTPAVPPGPPLGGTT